MFKRGDYLMIQHKHDDRVYIKDIAEELGVHLVDRRPIRNLVVAPAAAGIGTGIKQLGQPGIIQVRGKRPARCRAWARLSSFWMPPTLSLVLRLMSRMDRPAACRSRSTSRSLRIVVLLPGMG